MQRTYDNKQVENIKKTQMKKKKLNSTNCQQKVS